MLGGGIVSQAEDMSDENFGFDDKSSPERREIDADFH
jgi:hypothetical protein